MTNCTKNSTKVSIGLDLGDHNSYVVGVKRDGEIMFEDKKVPTTKEAFRKFFSSCCDPKSAQVVFEAGTHSPWISSLLESLGLKVIVANPTIAGRIIAANGKKNDRIDALTLATLGFDSLRLLRPIKHRRARSQNDLAVIRARNCAVGVRTQLINCVRGLVKCSGERLPKCGAPSFHRKVADSVPSALKPAIEPLLQQIGELTALIRGYDRTIEQLCNRHPETKRLQAINGVGPLIALAFVLTIDDPKRFRSSRDVGAYLGLVPRQFQSAECALQLRISKAGDTYLRQLLVIAAQYILGPFGEDCELRRFGLRVASRGAAKGKKRAVVAVARKLAVLMHRLLLSDDGIYDPFYRETLRRRRA